MTHIVKDDGSTKLTLTILYHLIEAWQDKLNLHHWTIDVSHRKPLQGHDMEIVMTPKRNHAALRIADHVYEYPRHRVAKLIIHELLHIILERVEDQKRFSKEEAGVNLEQAIEHLVKVIYSS